jgi:hypothetical protein
MNYSFCKTASVASMSSTKFHIRRLTRAGQKLSGGADSPALCGRAVSWDVTTPLDAYSAIEFACLTCREAYFDAVSPGWTTTL